MWKYAFETFITGLAGIAVYFIYDLISEFKTFKTDTRADVSTLKLQRSQFEITVRNAELSIGLRSNEMQKQLNEFSLDIKQAVMKFSSETQTFDKFMRKSLELAGQLNDKMKHQEKDLKDLKVQLSEVMIFKGQPRSGRP